MITGKVENSPAMKTSNVKWQIEMIKYKFSSIFRYLYVHSGRKDQIWAEYIQQKENN